MTRTEAIERLDYLATQNRIQVERLTEYDEQLVVTFYAASVEALEVAIEALKERDLVYGELNKALGGNAPQAWDRIKAGLTS